jgi:sulfite exporter TauE/SafE
MTNLLVPVVAASVVGSLHCAGMCGGLVAFATGDSGRAGGRVAPHAAYHVTRGLGYALIGAMAGIVGATVDGMGIRMGLTRVAGVVAGCVMLLWGALRLLEAGGVTLKSVGLPDRFEERLARLIRAARARPPVVRSAVIGACTAALPCGLLHAFAIIAAGTGTAAGGAAVMTAFWLGTVPALVGLGAGVQFLTARLRRHAALVSALALVVVGVWSVSGRLSIPLPPASASGQPSTLVCHGR